MSKYEATKPAAPAFNVSVDWERVFQGRPFSTPKFEHIEDAALREKAAREWREQNCTTLPAPVIAAKSCLVQPPAAEITNPKTGEVRVTRTPYPIGPWELLVNMAVVPPRREWWPVAARARSRMREFRRFESQHDDE